MEIKFEDFIQACEQCKGEGMIHGGTRSSGWSRTCEACAGRGTILTKQGQELFRIIEHLKHKHHL